MYFYPVAPENHNPVLSNGDVSPSNGDTETDFEFTVDYYDQDGDAPQYVNVHINGAGRTMQLKSGVANNGTYSYTTTLPAGNNHSYRFGTRDTENGYTGTDYESGPIVEEIVSLTRIIRIEGDLAFGSVSVGDSPARTMTIYNDGDSTLTISSISYPAGFSGNWSSGTIAAGDSQNATVTFSPSVTQEYSGPITVNSDKTSGINTISCSGTGIDALPLTLSPASRNHGSEGGTGSFDVITDLAWMINIFSPGIEISSGYGWFQGAGTVNYSVAPNTGEARTLVINIYADDNGTPRYANFEIHQDSISTEVPDVTGKTQQEAEEAILAAGLSNGKVTYRFNDTVSERNVISQAPIAGANVADGSSVDLVVSLGERPDSDTNEGCTPRFWKDNSSCWCDAYTPDTQVSVVFTALQFPTYANMISDKSNFSTDTLMDTLNYRGGRGLEGAARNLLRHATAALLNTCDTNVDYPVWETLIIDLTNAVLTTEDTDFIQELHSVLAEFNEYGCPIDVHNTAPIAADDVYAATMDTVLNITDAASGVLQNDYDPDPDILSAVLHGGGTTSLGGIINLNSDGTFSYTPPTGVTGMDSFAYYVTDSYNNSDTASATISITAP